MATFRSTAHYHTPPNSYRHIFHSVLRAGHHRVAPDFDVGNWPYPGHDLILSVRGTASVQIGARTFAIKPGDLVWVDCHHPTASWPSRPEPWELLWMHVDSQQADAIAKTLNVAENPLFTLRKAAAAAASYKQVFTLLRTRPVAMEAALHAVVTTLLTTLFEVRQCAASMEINAGNGLQAGHDLAKILDTMRVNYTRRWKVHELARLMNLSEPQFFRRFNKATGSSPMDWLRRERINHAKRRLAETRERIDSIAAGVGYSDPHYFSRDFKELVGVSPRHYRLQEHALHPVES